MNEIVSKILAIIGFGGKSVPGAPTSGTEVLQKVPDLLQIAQRDHLFNRANYRTMVQYAIIEAGIILVLIAAAIWIILSANPQDRFFVASVDGRITRIFPLDTPTANNGEMYTRVGTGVAAALTFGFLDYDQRKQEVAPLFELAAQEVLYKAFLGTDGLNAMMQKNYIYISEVEPSRPGGVIAQGVSDDNIYRWTIKIPLRVTRKIGADDAPESVTRWDVTVLVERARALEISRGIIVTQILGATKVGSN